MLEGLAKQLIFSRASLMYFSKTGELPEVAMSVVKSVVKSVVTSVVKRGVKSVVKSV